MRRPSQSIAVVLMTGSLLAACSEVEERESTYSPATVTPIQGRDDGIQLVSFTADAARRADVKTAKVQASGRHTLIPYASLIYAEDGATYAYVSPKPLVYMREPIDVDHIAGDRVVLRDGPPRGTTVVTTGAAAVYSTESGVDH